MVAGQEDGEPPGGDSTWTADITSLHSTGQSLPPKTTSFRRNFANRVWTSPSYKKARQQERFDPPQVLLLDTSGPLGARCKALADPEAIPYLEPSTAPQEQEARLMLQCLWSRSIIAIIASLPTIAPQEELALGLLQAIKASAAIAILTVPRDHSLLRSPEISACLHDSAFHMCPSPSQGEVILASSKLPTWPCPDSELLALEALGRISKLPLRLGHIKEITYDSLLKTSGPFVAHRPPICDGAGAPSSADHSIPHTSGISKASKAWIEWARKSDLSHRVFAHISQSRPEHPLSQEEQSEALAVLCSALDLDQASMSTVSPGQPFRLNLMRALAELIEDTDQELPTILAEGVHTGVFSEIKPSGLWPPAKLQPLSQSGLEVCQGNWRPAEEDPETVAALLADEEAAGWIQQVPGGLKAAKKRWPKGIAVGKLSLVKAEGRDPRLVLDSTICQVNPLCRIPEAVSMPTVQEVRRSFQPQDPRGAYISASIDFKTAHKGVKVHDTEQGLLLFAFNGILWRYVVCHFGAKFSAYWWQRVGGLITRILHASLAQFPHRAWLYVDDLLAALLRTSAHESLLIIVLLLSCLGAPISWKKASVGDSLIWCGWKFNFAYETVELCAAKRAKLSLQIQSLLSKPKVPRKDLEACIGLLIMWATNISPVLRPYVAPLYRLLNSPPGANYSIAPRMWPLFLHCLDSRAVFVREAMGLSIPLNSRVIEWGNRPVHCKSDLPLMAKPTGHTWIRISDPSCPTIKMTRAAQASLAWLAPRISAIPTTPLSLPPLLSSLARADAMAEGDQVGIGGWVSTKHGLAWFAESYSMNEVRAVWPFLTKDAHKYIACFETLAQLALAMTAKAHLGHTRLSLSLPSESDNTPTEGGVNKLFTTSWPLSEFLSLIASWSSANGVTLQVSHVAGAHNEWADDLSRGRLQAFAHRTRDRLRVPLEMLASASAGASWSSRDPSQVSPIGE